MKTNVQSFCQEFSKELDPFASQLGDALSTLSQQRDLAQLNGTVLSLREVQQRLSTLQEKISGQQAFLLIFGPLKSGKSTLMNAISGAYVSEVSSLPAYPALVYVKNGDERRYQATTYEGEKREFRDNLDMTAAVQEDHARLASAILEVERSGQEFDPKQHYPEAIRRMDIEVPARNLGESGTVLVDTPGLYSRMKFGYDLMTRDFRDTAACAIFVVKTDNLFFEKVFEEFEDLLGNFSRIFLVSNIDTSKKDLKPDGSLEDSLESRDPGKVIEAFRSLSMSATLREAIEDGRLKIYPIDLLKAASKSLQEASQQGDNASATATLEADSDEEDEVHAWEDADEVVEVEDEASDGFDHFLEDLTGYLNSSDYMHDFMFDSLRMARDLSTEASQLVLNGAADELRQSSRELRQQLDQDRDRLMALNNLEKVDWTSVFEHLYTEKDRLVTEMSHNYSRKLGENLQAAIDEWMETDESWNELVDNRLNGHLKKETNNDADAILGQLRGLIDTPQGGARFSNTQLDNFNKAGLKIGDVVSNLLQQLGKNVDADSPRLDIQMEDIPLNRNFGDMCMLRSSKQVRTQLFGHEGDEPIPPARKQKRLAGPGVERLKDIVASFADDQLPSQQKTYVNQVLDTYVEDFNRTLQQELETMKTQLHNSMNETESKLKFSEKNQRLLEEIKSSAESFQAALTGLYEHFGVDEEPQKGMVEDESNAGASDSEAETVDAEIGEPRVDPERVAEEGELLTEGEEEDDNVADIERHMPGFEENVNTTRS